MAQGDIVFCYPVIAREALAQGKSLEAHFAHLIVHGLLHLQGHRHAGRREATHMETLEKKLLAKLGYPDPYDDSGVTGPGTGARTRPRREHGRIGQTFLT